MNAQASLSSSHIERVAEELLSVDTADMRFLAVYFEEEFPLYELRYTCAYSFLFSSCVTQITFDPILDQAI